MKSEILLTLGILSWMGAYFISKANLREERFKIRELQDQITTARQFQYKGETYRCYHFPKIKEEEDNKE